MAEPTATGKTVLVIIETQAGPQPQLWHQDRGGFVGCAHLKPIETYPLPPAVTNDGWTIERAISYTMEKRSHAA